MNEYLKYLMTDCIDSETYELRRNDLYLVNNDEKLIWIRFKRITY